MKNRMFLLCLLFFLLNTLSAQTWTQRSSLPGGARARIGATAFTVYDSLSYIIGGFKGGTGGQVYQDFWRYKHQNDTWQIIGNFVGGRKWGQVAFVIDSIAYIGVGANQFDIVNQQFWSYNVNTGNWSPIASFPGPGRVYASSFSINGKGYVGGGIQLIAGNIFFLSDFWEYDPSTNIWTQKASFGGGLRGGAIAFSHGGKGYMGYGEDQFAFRSDFYRYDPVIDFWTSLPNPAPMNTAFGSVAVSNNQAYIIGGEFLFNLFVPDVWKYSINTNTWTQQAHFPGIPRRHSVAFSSGNSIYYGTGQSGPQNSDAEDDLWELSVPLSNNEKEIHLNSFNISPNPSNGVFNISFNTTEINVSSIKVMDVHGNVWFTENDNGRSYGKKRSIDLRKRAAGIYFLEVKCDKGVFVKKLFKY